jgi:hypothetical protein
MRETKERRDWRAFEERMRARLAAVASRLKVPRAPHQQPMWDCDSLMAGKGAKVDPQGAEAAH